MSGQTDFHHIVEQAAGLAMEATCAARTAAYKSLPTPHRRLLNSAIRNLERAQDALFQARNDPWSYEPKQGYQLHLC